MQYLVIFDLMKRSGEAVPEPSTDAELVDVQASAA